MKIEAPYVCPTACDDDCEERCHEGHQVWWKQAHDPAWCDRLQYEERSDRLLARLFNTAGNCAAGLAHLGGHGLANQLWALAGTLRNRDRVRMPDHVCPTCGSARDRQVPDVYGVAGDPGWYRWRCGGCGHTYERETQPDQVSR